MREETVIEKILKKVCKFFKITKHNEISKSEMCKRSQSVCSHDCDSCAWNE